METATKKDNLGYHTGQIQCLTDYIKKNSLKYNWVDNFGRR